MPSGGLLRYTIVLPLEISGKQFHVVEITVPQMSLNVSIERALHEFLVFENWHRNSELFQLMLVQRSGDFYERVATARVNGNNLQSEMKEYVASIPYQHIKLI